MKRLMRHRKLMAGLVVVAALLTIALWPRTLPVDVATVTRGPLVVTIDEEGETRVRRRFVVSAPVSGRVLRIALEPGDEVRRGETVVATMLPGDPLPLDARSRAEAEAAVAAARAALERARGEIARAEVDVDRARREVDRHRPLRSAGVVSDDDFEAREAALRAAEEGRRVAQLASEVAGRELALAQARLVVGPSRGASQAIEIRAPIDGVVLWRHRESEAVVAAGEPLLDLGDPADLEIVADLLSSDAVRVSPGTLVRIAHWGGEAELMARVRRVEPSGFTKISALGVEEQRVNVIADFVDPAEAWRALGDRFRVEVRVVVWEGQDVVKAPTSSLFRHAGGWAVFVVDAGRAHLRPVEIGQRNGLEAQVVSRLAVGDVVIVHPADTIEDGGRVLAR
jgi:HlyD family secretion protein